jgi:hypothetical protein
VECIFFERLASADALLACLPAEAGALASATVLASRQRMSDVHLERDRLNHLSNVISGAAIRVHDGLGPGTFETPYEECLVCELSERGVVNGFPE